MPDLWTTLGTLQLLFLATCLQAVCKDFNGKESARLSNGNYFEEKDVRIIKEEVLDYINRKDRKLSVDTVQRYLDDIDFFLSEYILGKVMKGDHVSCLSSSVLKHYFSKPRSNTAPTAIAILITLWEEQGRLELKFSLDTKRKLSKYVVINVEELNFLEAKDIEFIFGNSVDFNPNDIEKKIIYPVIWGLCVYCGLEQSHIKLLTVSDINIPGKLIRNIRSDTDDTLIKWIKINDDVLIENLERYMTYRRTLDLKTETFILYKGKEPKDLNKFFSMLRDRSRNSDNLSTTVDAQKLVRTGVLLALLRFEGKTAIEYIRIHGVQKSTQLNNALIEYMTIKNSQESYFQD
ncbi:hypothetical protein [Cohnella sp. WQ 127256]|uniref:hypothetical protein n=1 Tax=Cohnella sp. WQ 127256 TaxID=2938790 RepID=UPI0021193E75|nr:hypothetical protein [Cohnella sp. WQ 127256]